MTTPFLSYPSQFILVKLIKLKRTQTVFIEIERKRERNREQTESLGSRLFYSVVIKSSKQVKPTFETRMYTGASVIATPTTRVCPSP
jgi:hypothetical protein